MEKTYKNVNLSAEFKRDYVAIMAVICFVCIVLGEVALAISIPWYLHREDTMAYQVMRLRLLDNFDNLRTTIYRTSPSDDVAAAELKLVSWNLNLLADYLRAESDHLTKEEIADLNKHVVKMSAVVGKARSNRSVSHINKLDTASYVNKLIPTLERR